MHFYALFRQDTIDHGLLIPTTFLENFVTRPRPIPRPRPPQSFFVPRSFLSSKSENHWVQAYQCLYEFKMAAVGFREKRKLAQKADIFVKFEAKERYNNIRQILKKDPSLRNDEELQMMANSQEIVQEIEKRSLRQELAKRRVEEVRSEAVLIFYFFSIFKRF